MGDRGYNEPHKRHLLKFRDWQSWASAAVAGGEQVSNVWDVLYRCAIEEDRHQDRALFLAYVLGRPRTRPVKVDSEQVESVDATRLDSIDACLEATQQVLELQRSGALDAEEAEAVRRTIELALRAHSAKKDATLADELAGAMARPLYLEASASREEKLAAVAARLDENGEEDLGGE